ncbi:MAG: hypothetical protein AB8H80_17185 [Planctomycetota bacterium]
MHIRIANPAALLFAAIVVAAVVALESAVPAPATSINDPPRISKPESNAHLVSPGSRTLSRFEPVLDDSGQRSGHSIEGVVRSGTRPIANARIDVVAPGASVATVSGEEGGFRLLMAARTEQSSALVLCRAAGYREARRDVRLPFVGELVFDLQPKTSLVVRIDLNTPRDVGTVSMPVELSNQDGAVMSASSWTFVDGAGSLVLLDQECAEVTASVALPSGRLRRASAKAVAHGDSLYAGIVFEDFARPLHVILVDSEDQSPLREEVMCRMGGKVSRHTPGAKGGVTLLIDPEEGSESKVVFWAEHAGVSQEFELPSIANYQVMPVGDFGGRLKVKGIEAPAGEARNGQLRIVGTQVESRFQVLHDESGIVFARVPRGDYRIWCKATPLVGEPVHVAVGEIVELSAVPAPPGGISGSVASECDATLEFLEGGSTARRVWSGRLENGAKFAVGDLIPGDYLLNLRFKEPGEFIERVRVDSGEETCVGHLDPTSAAPRVLQIVDELGERIANQMIEWQAMEPSGSGPHLASTDREGVLAIALSSAIETIQLSVSGGRALALVRTASEVQHTVALHVGELSLPVALADGQSLPHSLIAVYEGTDSVLFVQCLRQGAARFVGPRRPPLAFLAKSDRGSRPFGFTSSADGYQLLHPSQIARVLVPAGVKDVYAKCSQVGNVHISGGLFMHRVELEDREASVFWPPGFKGLLTSGTKGWCVDVGN